MRKLLSIILAVTVLFSSAAVISASAEDKYYAASSAGRAAVRTAAVRDDTAVTADGPDDDAPAVNYPEIVSIIPDSSGFTIKWTAYQGAAKYRLFYRGASGWIKIGDTASTTLKHSGLNDKTKYTYTVRALDAAGKYSSSYLVAGWSMTFRSAPALTSVTVVGNTLKVSWKGDADFTCYRVYRKEGSSWVGVVFTEDTCFIDENVVSGKTYTYTVRAVDGAHKTLLSAFSAKGVSGTFVSVPLITGVEAKNSGVRISWGKANGAAMYRVFTKAVSGWKRIGDTSGLYFDYNISPNNIETTYTVRAMNASGTAYTSDFSREGFKHAFLNTPVLTSLTNLDGAQKLSWNVVPGAQRYRIYIKNGSVWKGLANTADTSYTINNVKNNTVYTYTVRCISADGKLFHSGFSPSGITARYFDVPKVTSVENLTEGAKVTWKAVAGVSRYRVFIKNGASWKALANVNGTSYVHKTAEQGVTYVYTVRAVDNKGSFISSFDPEGFSNLFITAPIINTVAPSDEGTVLSWIDYYGAAGYRVYRRTVGASWGRIGDVAGTTFTDTTAVKGTPYQYTLRCLDEEGNLVSGHHSDVPFYVDGVLAEGKINVKGYYVTFSKGKITKGYVTAQNIIDIAKAEVGTRAKNYKYCKYNNWYYGGEVSGEEYDWCVVFFMWVFDQANCLELLHGKTAGAELLGAQFFEARELVRSNYRVGDLLLLHWNEGYSSYVPGVKLLNHVALVISVNDDGTFTTVEGNTGDDPNGEVMIRTRRLDQVSCACRPKYGFYIPAK